MPGRPPIRGFAVPVLEPTRSCHAGLAVWQRSNGKPQWFFSHPSPLEAQRKSDFSRRRRQRLVLRISQGEGRSWPREVVNHEQAAAYSDVAVLAENPYDLCHIIDH